MGAPLKTLCERTGNSCLWIRQSLSVFFSGLLFLLSVYGTVMVYLWVTDSAPAIEFGSGSASVESAHPGDTVVFFQQIKKLRNCPGRFQQILSGDCGYHILKDNPTYLTEGFNGKVQHVVVIPFEALPGHCFFKVKVTYQCDPLDAWLGQEAFESPPIAIDIVPNP